MNDYRLMRRGRTNNDGLADRVSRGANCCACAGSKFQSTGTELRTNNLPRMHCRHLCAIVLHFNLEFSLENRNREALYTLSWDVAHHLHIMKSKLNEKLLEF